MDQLAYKPDPAAKAANTSKVRIYEAINSGALKAYKNGSATLILKEDLLNWIRSLPEYEHKSSEATE